MDHSDYGATIDKIISSGAEVVFNTIVPPGLVPFLEQLYKVGFHVIYQRTGVYKFKIVIQFNYFHIYMYYLIQR